MKKIVLALCAVLFLQTGVVSIASPGATAPSSSAPQRSCNGLKDKDVKNACFGSLRVGAKTFVMCGGPLAIILGLLGTFLGFGTQGALVGLGIGTGLATGVAAMDLRTRIICLMIGGVIREILHGDNA